MSQETYVKSIHLFKKGQVNLYHLFGVDGYTKYIVKDVMTALIYFDNWNINIYKNIYCIGYNISKAQFNKKFGKNINCINYNDIWSFFIEPEFIQEIFYHGINVVRSKNLGWPQSVSLNYKFKKLRIVIHINLLNRIIAIKQKLH